jgi:hypothetical protein
MFGDYLEKYIISIIYEEGRKGFLSSYFGDLSLITKKGLVMYRKRRLHKRKEIAKLILMRGIYWLRRPINKSGKRSKGNGSGIGRRPIGGPLEEYEKYGSTTRKLVLLL